MKKLKNLTFACLLILGLAACADDDKSSSNNPPVIDNSETVTLEFTGEIGKETVNTITFTNPHAVEADLRVNINSVDSSIKIDTASSTCDNIVDNTYYYTINSKLAAGESCEVKYTFQPTKLDTILLQLQVDYTRTFEAVCPTPDTVPSFEQLLTNNKYVEMNVYNYAVDSNGNKSPEFINIEIPAEWSVTGNNASSLNAVSHIQSFDLPAKQGEYSFNIYSGKLDSNNKDCSISNDSYNTYTLSVKNNNGCSLKVTTASSGMSPIKFSPKQEDNPYYNVNVDVNSDYTYSILYTQYGYIPTFYPDYYISSSSGNTYFYVALLTNKEKITSYEITGINANKFKVAGTKHNSCTVTDTEISIPEGQENCFFTVEIADKTESGDFTATLNTTSSTGSTNTYNINGTVSLLSIQDMLQNYCKENTQSNKAYKLF